MSVDTTTTGQQNQAAQDDQKVEVSGQFYPWRKFTFGGLAAFCAVALTQILTKDSLDTALTISIYCFAFSIPFLVLPIAFDVHESSSRYTLNKRPWYIADLAILATFISFIGIIALFWHFSIFAGIIFSLASVFCIWVYVKN